MKALALTAAVLLLSGCMSAPVYEAAVGVNVSRYTPWSQGQEGGFEGGRDTVRFTVRQDVTQHTFVSYSHLSHLSHGWPVNDKAEDWLDVAEFGVRFGGRQ